MEFFVAAFGVWILWTIGLVFLEAPDWAWRTLAVALGVGAMILIDSDSWWLGIGIGGLAAAIMMVTDLLLVTTDWIRVHILRPRR